MQSISIEKFLQLKQTYPLLDTRSPSEYKDGHIPGAVSFPLFSDEERSIVGKSYKNKGRDTAIKRALDLVGPKMKEYITQAEALNSDTLLIHCWRGGMRSQSIAWLLDLYGFNVHVLEGGYKTYRRALLSYFEEPLKLNVLAGYTGSLKTEVLLEMKKIGAQVVDLEGIANHQGSSFGNMLSDEQPTTEQFQNNLYENFLELNRDKEIWLEDESFLIGRVCLIEPLFNQKEEASHILLDIPKKVRVESLVRGYGEISTLKLIEATQAIEKRLGGLETKQALKWIKNGELGKAADVILTYYDRAYDKARAKKKDKIACTISIESDNPHNIAQTVLETWNNKIQ